MCGNLIMSPELQQEVWNEMCKWCSRTARKNLTHLGIQLNGNDRQFMEISITDNAPDIGYLEFLEVVDEIKTIIATEFPMLKVQQFSCDIPIEVDFDLDAWEDIIQISIDESKQQLLSQFRHYQRVNADIVNRGVKTSVADDLEYLKFLQDIALELDVEYVTADDMYVTMLNIEKGIIAKYGKK
ncbi:hypothetical protein [Methanobrevibacter sp.]|uniref:hypothetical protein n=1 Tax=Methanobrevibacter sp. TaxID=66852 RepID=UPI0038681ADF